MLLTQPRSIGITSKEFPKSLTKILASRGDVVIAMSLQGDDALILIGILDQARLVESGHHERSFNPLNRLSRLRTWALTSEARAFVSSGDSVVRRPSCHVLACSRTTPQRRVTSHLLILECLEMFGKVTTMGIVCVLECSVSLHPRTCSESSGYAPHDLTWNVHL